MEVKARKGEGRRRAWFEGHRGKRGEKTNVGAIVLQIDWGDRLQTSKIYLSSQTKNDAILHFDFCLFFLFFVSFLFLFFYSFLRRVIFGRQLLNNRRNRKHHNNYEVFVCRFGNVYRVTNSEWKFLIIYGSVWELFPRRTSSKRLETSRNVFVVIRTRLTVVEVEVRSWRNRKALFKVNVENLMRERVLITRRRAWIRHFDFFLSWKII